MGKLIPIILALVGLGAGAGAGIFLRPAPEPAEHGAEGEAPPAEHAAEESPETLHDYVKLSNQFVVPVVEAGRVASLVILSVSLEVELGKTEEVYAKEPKIRDAFLQVLFDHANSGGFRGTFTDGSNMVLLRRALNETAQKAMGSVVTDVLITDIVRQDS